MIRAEHSPYPVVARTHPGRRGKNNEDRFGVSVYRLTPRDPVTILLAVLSDGIGGHRAGEVASELAVNRISQVVAAGDPKDPPAVLRRAVLEASTAIHEQADANPDQAGMGATCAIVWVIGGQLYTATVGDSRIYLLRRGALLRLSTDHTWVQEALERGLLQPGEEIGHPNAHVIRRYLGGQTPPEADFRLRLNPAEDDRAAEANQGAALYPGDRLLLCSDGLTDLVSDEEIGQALGGASMEIAAQTLETLANERGGHDNITLIALEIPHQTIPQMQPVRRRRVWGCAAGLILALLILGAALGGLLNVWGTRGSTSTATPTVTVTAPLLPATATRPPAVEPVRPSATLVPLPPTSTPPAPTPARPAGGPTLTPWPTNTRAP